MKRGTRIRWLLDPQWSLTTLALYHLHRINTPDNSHRDHDHLPQMAVLGAIPRALSPQKPTASSPPYENLVQDADLKQMWRLGGGAYHILLQIR